jgi:hypothetical protein
MTSRALFAALLTLGCSTVPIEEAPPDPGGPAAPAPAAPEGPDCDAHAAEVAAMVEEVRGGACTFDVDCVVASVEVPECLTTCPFVTTPRALAALSELEAQLVARCAVDCPGVEAADCGAPAPRCLEGVCVAGEEGLGETPIPEENALARADDPPPRPGTEAAQEPAARLFRAIVEDDPRLAQDFFMPREAFSQMKGIADADGYWRRLFLRYAEDVHALHGQLGDLEGATFERLEIVRRGGWVRPREEGNRLPYWAARHNRLHYRVGEEARSVEVRVLITWGSRWYLAHLREFR